MAAMLDGMVDKVVQIVTNDGRNIVGMLKGFDQTTNVILDECHERVFSPEAGVEQARACATGWPARVRSRPNPPIRSVRRSSLGFTLCAATICVFPPYASATRPQSSPTPPSPACALLTPARARPSAVVGEVDEAEDGDLDWTAVVAEPLKPVVH